jgi:hypothetical protein
MLQGDFVMVLLCFRNSDQNLEETGNKNSFSDKDQTNKPWSNNLTGTRREKKLIVTNKSPTMDEECDCNFLIYYAVRSIKKG